MHAKIFIQLACQGNHLIVLGLYPVSNDFEGKIGTTEGAMLQHLDPTVFPENKCMWVDFCVMSSTTTNSTIDQKVIASWVNDTEMVKDYYRRLSIYLHQQNDDRMPCVYIAGKTCQQTFDKAVESGFVKRIAMLSSSYDIHLCEMDGIKFITLLTQPNFGSRHSSLFLEQIGLDRETYKVMGQVNGF